MSREDIVAVAVRLFAVFIFFAVIQSIPALMYALSSEFRWQFAIPIITALFAWMIFCAVLWFLPLPIARRLLPVMKEPRSEQTIDASIALTLGLTLLGVWFLANAIIDSVYWLIILSGVRQTYDTSFNWDHNAIAKVCTVAVKLVLALWLLIGTAGIKRAIYRLRRS